jgi:hypothetical protein
MCSIEYLNNISKRETYSSSIIVSGVISREILLREFIATL